MSGEERLLCVGGPADGQYANIATSKRSVVVASFNPPAPDYLANIEVYSHDPVPIRETRYVRRHVSVGATPNNYYMATLCILVPYGAEPAKTLDNLLANYANRSNDK